MNYVSRSMIRYGSQSCFVRGAGVTISLLLLTRRAMAQAVAGAIDPSTGLANLAPYVLGLATAAIVIITMWKGAHAVAEGRSLGPHIIGLVGGLALAVGGYYVLNHYGVTTTTAT